VYSDVKLWVPLRNRVGVLLDQFLDVRQQQNSTAPFSHGVSRDSRHQGRLAAARRNLNAWIIAASP
jgi:hypothetical protein